MLGNVTGRTGQMVANVDENALLRAYRPWLRATAWNMIGTRLPHLTEDLAQEGWVALWRAIRAESPDWCVCGAPITSAQQARGWTECVACWRTGTATRTRPARTAPLDWWLKRCAATRMRQVTRNWLTAKNTQHVFAPEIHEQLHLASLLPDMELAYHHGEIMSALAQLTPRERRYVVLRFWCGYNYPDTYKDFGHNTSSIWISARKKLRAALAHLETTHA